jgi:metal-dependent hydrolase (beta-lactamase superfamily II)
VLFDAGQGTALFNNAATLDIDLATADATGTW